MVIVSSIIAVLAFALSFYTYFIHDRKLKNQEELLNLCQLCSLEQNEEVNKKAIVHAKAVKYKTENKTLYIYNLEKVKERNLKVDTLLLSEGDDELTIIYESKDDYSENNSEK